MGCMEIRTERRILMIDDEPYFSELVKDILQNAHCTVSTFSDPHEGLREALMRNDLDLILLDVEMPELNGIEILRQIKKSHNHKVPVMMLTAHAEMDVVTKALNQGAQDYLLKPFAVKPFVDRLNKLLHTDLFKQYQTLTGEPGTGPQATPIHRQILYVEKDPEAILAFEEMLADSICQIEICQDLKTAQTAMETEKPDVLVLSLDLSTAHEQTLLQEIQKSQPKIPIIVLSETPSEAPQAEAQKYQLQALLPKPCPVHILISQLEKALKVPLFAGRL